MSEYLGSVLFFIIIAAALYSPEGKDEMLGSLILKRIYAAVEGVEETAGDE